MTTTWTNHTHTPVEVRDMLNAWEAENPLVGDPGDGADIWEELILKIDGYNEFATQAADPQQYGNRFVVNFPDGQRHFRYDDKRHEWVIRPL